MKGNNEMDFNQATMIEAVQHYLEKIMKELVPVVTDVVAKGYNNNREFTISITDAPKEEE